MTADEYRPVARRICEQALAGYRADLPTIALSHIAEEADRKGGDETNDPLGFNITDRRAEIGFERLDREFADEIGSWFVYTTKPEEVKRAPKGKSTSTDSRM